MAILTRPTSFNKGESSVFSLTVADLEAKVAALGGDAYYQNSVNWKQVVVTWESDNQLINVSFDIEGNVLDAGFSPSAAAKDAFNVLYLNILDYDGGYFRINAANLTEAEFASISLVGGGDSGSGDSGSGDSGSGGTEALNRDFSSPNTFLGGESTYTNSGGDSVQMVNISGGELDILTSTDDFGGPGQAEYIADLNSISSYTILPDTTYNVDIVVHSINSTPGTEADFNLTASMAGYTQEDIIDLSTVSGGSTLSTTVTTGNSVLDNNFVLALSGGFNMGDNYSMQISSIVVTEA